MQIQRQRQKEGTENRNKQIPSGVPVIDNSDLLDKLQEAGKEDEGTDFDSMDDGSPLDDGEGGCTCW
jgi:hypothetical protein